MDFLLRFFIFILLVYFWSAKAIEVPCERVEKSGGFVDCFMDQTTAITSDTVKISDAREESISKLWFDHNSKIFFLPIEIHEKFPNLIQINAFNCSISTISKSNFVKLSKLRILYLENNKIEKIDSDTFDDLISLEEIDLSKCFLSFKKNLNFSSLFPYRTQPN